MRVRGSAFDAVLGTCFYSSIALFNELRVGRGTTMRASADPRIVPPWLSMVSMLFAS